MRFRGVLEGNLPIDAHVERAVLDPAEHLSSAPDQLVSRGGVVRDGRSGEKERAMAQEQERIERRDDAARLAEQRHHPARREALETLLERRRADRVVYDLRELAAGDARYLGDEVLLRVDD